MWPREDDQKTLPDDLRCRRSDGRKWRCYGRRLDGAKYCDYHFNKMRIFHERFKGSVKLGGGHEISSSNKKQNVSSDPVEIKEKKEKRRYRKRSIVELTAEGSSVKKLKADHNRPGLARNKARSVNKQSTSVGMTTIRPYCFKWPGIYVPVRFAKANGLFNRNCDMEVEDEAGRRWPVKLWAKPYDGQVYIRKGWGDFQNAHDLKIGDEIRFELISGEEKPVLKCCIQRQPSSAAAGELQGSQPLVQSQEVHAKRPRGRPKLLPSSQAVKKHLKKEKIAQQCHDSCAAASEGRLSKDTVSGGKVLERCSSPPVVEVESLNESASEGQSSHIKSMDGASGKSVLKALVPYTNSEHPVSPQDSTAPPVREGNSVGSFPLASLDGDGQNKVSTSQNGTEVEKTGTSVLFQIPSPMRVYNSLIDNQIDSPVDNPIEQGKLVDGQGKAPTSQCGTKVGKTVSSVLDETPSAMRLYSSPPDNSKKGVDHFDGQRKAPTSLCGTKAGKSISSVLLETTSVAWAYKSPADNSKKRMEPVDGQRKTPSSPCGTIVGKTICSALLETLSAMSKYNSADDNSKKGVKPVVGQSKAPTSQCGSEVDRTISSALLKTSNTMRISDSRADNPAKRVELVDGQSEPPTSQSGKKVGRSMTSFLFKTPGAMSVYNSPADDPIEHEEHVNGQSKALASQCDTKVDKSISSPLLKTPSAMRIYTSPADNPTKRGKPVDGPSKAPTSDYGIKAEKTMLEIPPALIEYSFLTDDPAKRVEPIINISDPSSILDAIVSQHGDIAKDCTLKSPLFKSALLCGICSVAQELHNMKPDNIQSTRLEEFYSAIRDAEGVKIDVNWLRQTLDEISKIKEAIKTSEKFKDEERRSAEKANSYRKVLQTKRGKMEELQSKMEELQSEIKDVEKKLESENFKIGKLRGTIEGIKSSSEQVVRVI